MPDFGDFLTSVAWGAAFGALALAAPVKFFTRVKTLAPARYANRLFVLGVLAFGGTFAFLDLGKFDAFNVYGIDFALFDQVVWNSARGRLFENSVVWDAPILLGQRFSPILLSIVPLYAVWSNPRVLILAPAISVAITAIPIYWFARKEIGRWLALVVALAFLLLPGVQFIALGHFIEVLFAMPLLGFAGLFLLRRRDAPMLVCLALALLCKEEMAFVAAGFGLYIFFAQRRFIFGATLTAACLAWVVFLLQVVIPSFAVVRGYYYFGGSESYGSGLYGYLGSGLAEIIVNAITRPNLVLEHLIVPSKMDAALYSLAPLGLPALLGGQVAALVLPTLGYTLLSDRVLQYVLGSYHYAPVFPLVTLGAVVGVKRVLIFAARFENRARIAAAVGAFIIASSVGIYYLRAPGPLAKNFDPARYAPTEHTRLGVALAQTIPPEAVVLAQSELVSHLAQRRDVYIMPGYPCLSGVDYLFGDTRQKWYEYREAEWKHVLASGFFETVFEQDGFILKKRAPPAPLEKTANVRVNNAMTFIGYSIPLTETLRGGQTLRIVSAWRAEQNILQRYTAQFSVADARGHVWSGREEEPCRGVLRTDRWKPGETIYFDMELTLPPTMPRGDYQLTVAWNGKHADALARAAHAPAEIKIAMIRVEKNKSSFTASQLNIPQPLFVDMREMRFMGFVPPRARIAPGEILQVGLYWRAREKPRGDYVVAVQLRDSAGRVAFEHSARPAADTYPTTQWDAGEVLLDWHDFLLPGDLARGDYHIFVLLRDAASRAVMGETAISKIQVLE